MLTPQGMRSNRVAPKRVDRRDWSPLGIARRARFEYSLELLRALGMSSASIEYYRRLARRTHRLPDELVCRLAEHAADDATLTARMALGDRPA